jgi:hypothetical protein
MLEFIKKRVLLLCVTASVVILSIAAALLYQAASGPQGTVDQYPLDKACYSLFDSNGREFKSWFPPIPAADAQGIYVFNNDHTWGYVFGPSAMVADRDCLRQRYPGDTIVPALEGEDK